MLVWATELPVTVDKTVWDVIDLCKEWVVGSPHSEWKGEDFLDPSNGETFSANLYGEHVSIALFSDAGEELAGFKYIHTDEQEREWITEIVSLKSKSELLVSVKVYCNMPAASPVAPRVKKPYVVKLLLKELGGGRDGAIPVMGIPFGLKEADVPTATKIIEGQFGNHLPIIYVSVTWSNAPEIDAKRLAQWAAGMAHVIVEPSRHFSFALARACNNQNAYDGAVGIYWPAGNLRTVFSLDRYKIPSHLSTAVANMVRRSLVNCRSTSACSWDFLQEHISQNKLEELRSTGSKKLDDYVEAFDAEIKAKDKRNENLRQENGRLCAEIQRLEAVAETKQNSVLSFGQEQPLYAGEFQDALLKVLQAGKGQVVSGGRYEDIVESVLSATHPVNKGTEIQAEIKRILSGSKNIGRGETRELEQLGFIVNDQGKHLNITFQGDPRYSFTTAKTGSDGRGLKNFLSDVNKKLFM